ncbi:Pentatricopeptide repeat-containing protein [Spatholobus suberectus]|nr:Pentatricopeptide repeat-containing protein [Spatholobus suberectus]
MASVAPPPLSCHHHHKLAIHHRTTWTWNHNNNHPFPSFTVPKSSLSPPTTHKREHLSRTKTHSPTQRHEPFFQRLHDLCDSGNLNEALNLLHSHSQNGAVSSSHITAEAIGLLLRACAHHKDIEVGRKLHAMVSSSHQLRNDVVLNTRFITMYSTCGSPSDSRSAFDAAEKKDLFLYNALLSGYARNALFRDAVSLFLELLSATELVPDSFTLPCVVKACAGLADAELGEAVHALALKGLLSEEEGLALDVATMVTVIPACAALGEVRMGMVLHGLAFKLGVSEEVTVNNSLVDMYSKCGKVSREEFIPSL